MKYRANLKFKLLFAGSLSIVLFSILSFLSLKNLALVQDTFWWVDHTQVVLKKATKIEKLLVDMETGQRGFLITGDEEFLEPYNLGRATLPTLIDETKQLVSDNPQQRERISEISYLIDQWQEKAGTFEIELRRKVNRGEIPQSEVVTTLETKLGKNLMDKLRSKLEKFSSTEVNLMKIRDREAHDSVQLLRNIIIYGSILAVLISFFVFSRVAKKITTPILELVNVSQKEFQQTLVNVPSPKNRDEDEVGELVKAYYQMLNGLKDEIVKRKTIEEKLNISHSKLETTVTERTNELTEAYVALKKSESKIRLITDSLPVLISYIDSGYRYQFNSKGYENWFGVPINEIQGKRVKDILGEDSFEKVKKYFDTALSGKKVDYETFMPYKHGPKRHVHAEFIPDIDEQGKVKGIFVLVTDITKSKQAEKELIESKEEAERANNAKSEFLSRMSHELRTPLNAILGFGQLVQSNPDEELTELQKGNLGHIMQAGKHLLELINEVLNLSRVEAGQFSITNENLNASLVMEECIAQIKPLADKKNIQISNRLSQQGNYFIRADHKAFTQIMLNLLSNAVKYNIESGVITVDGGASGNDQVWIGVSDDGPGISNENIREIFEPFNRLGQEFGDIKGTGIGLSISKSLAEQMDGSLSAECELGKGYFFKLELPAANRESVNVNISAPDSAVTKTDLQNKNQKILYVDDNALNLALVEEIFEARPQITFLSAEHPREGIELARFHRPDLILMDIHLPDMDGITAFRELQKFQETRDIPLIAVSALAMEDDIKKALDSGIKDYVTKPLDVKNFLEKIDKIFNQ